MKAVLCKAYGPPESLVLEETASLRPAEGQVVIAVKAAGVNFPDLLMIQNKYQFRPPLPFSPGGEVAGTVKELGANVANVKVGDRVIASTGFGGFAEEALAPAARCIAFPANMDFVEASAFVMTYGTSHHALKDRADLKAGETLLVLGAAGGVGLAAVEIGKVMGARVVAAASRKKKSICASSAAPMPASSIPPAPSIGTHKRNLPTTSKKFWAVMAPTSSTTASAATTPNRPYARSPGKAVTLS